MPSQSLFKIILQWITFFIALVLICLLIFSYFVYSRLLVDLPDIKTLHHVHYQTPLNIYTSDNLLIGQFGEQHRVPLPIDKIPKQLIYAFLAAEDERFFQHPGVDYKGLLRAGLRLVLSGQKKQGGSTITMQVVRNFLLSNEKTYIRKLKEVILALKVEREYPKNKILELYLNQIYMGHRSYGVNAAAQTYYGKPLDMLTLAEYAMIAGLPKAPSAYNPITNEARAIQRRNYVLHRMLELNYISKEHYDQALNQTSTAKRQSQPMAVSAPYVAEMVRQALLGQYGEKAYSSGFNVYTTIKGSLQTAANNALTNALHNYQERHRYGIDKPALISKYSDFLDLPVIGDTLPAYVTQVKESKIRAKLQNGTDIEIPEEKLKWMGDAPPDNFDKSIKDSINVGYIIRVRRLMNNHWTLARIPQVEGAFVALNTENGAILALTGGFDFFRNKFNRVTQSKRQPGSGFKPIIYTAALEQGFTPASIINDEPITIDNPEQEVEWRPENYNRSYLGPTSLRKALTHSSNIISIRLLDEIGIDKAVSTALRFGFTQQQLPKTLSLALGSGYASPLQMAQAYAAFANGGFLVKPYFIERIETREGSIIFQAKPKTACPACTDELRQKGSHALRVISPGICFLMNSLLRDVVQKGTAVDAKVLGRQDIAGKTGTTNDYRDAWFNGYSPSIAATAWVGKDNFESLGKRETGGKVALPMWIDFMKTALRNLPEAPLTIPEGIEEAIIEPGTGQLAPAGSKTGMLEYFLSGMAPDQIASTDDESATGSEPGTTKKTLDKDSEESDYTPVEALF